MYNVHHMESIDTINQQLCANAVPVSVIINFKQICNYIKCNLDRSHTRTHAHDKKHGVSLRWVARTRSPDWRDGWLGDNSTDLRLPTSLLYRQLDTSDLHPFVLEHRHAVVESGLSAC